MQKTTFGKKGGATPFTWLLLCIAVIVAGYMIVSSYKTEVPATKVAISQIQLDYKRSVQAYANGETTPAVPVIVSIEISDNNVTAEYSDGNKKQAYKDPVASSVDYGFQGTDKITVTVDNAEEKRFWTEIAFSVLPFLLLLGIAFFMLRNLMGQNKNAMSFGQTRATPVDSKDKKTTFADVAGCKEAKQELEEIADFLRNPKKYTKMGAKIPKGVMLVGAPGTGKTLLARAVAGEANVPFFSLSGSEFVEMFVGVGASRVRDLFKKAKRNAPCIIFIDELDAVGRQRGAGLGGGHDEREQTLNQILTEMDGFEKDQSVIVIAATNRPDVLDPALLRPGRFDRHVTLDRPDLKERLEILEVHARQKPIDSKADMSKIAKQTSGFVGAELENLLNEAAILAARADRKTVLQKDLEEAMEKVLMGPERKGRVMTQREKEIIAYHEAGHAVVGHFLPHCDPVHKISIVSRGMALGVTWFMPEEDERLRSVLRFKDDLASLMGGRVSEEVFFEDVTTGASNDLERVTKMAHDMVTRYGMSSLGNMTYGENEQNPFLGRELGHQRNYSEETAKLIDDEVKKLVEEAYKTAKAIVTKHKKDLEKLAHELLKKESLTRDEFEAMLPASKKAEYVSLAKAK